MAKKKKNFFFVMRLYGRYSHLRVCTNDILDLYLDKILHVPSFVYIILSIKTNVS